MRLRHLAQPIVIVPVLIVVAIVGVYWFGFRSDDAATASAASTRQLVAVTSGPMSVTVSAEGTVAAADTDDLSFGAAGTVTAVNVKAGDTVKAGQVLATIDSAQLQSAVSSAQATVADAEAKLADDQAAGASSEQIAADETSVASANDSLTNAQDALAGASLASTFDGTVAAVNITEGEQLGSGGTGGTASTGSASGSGQSSGSIGSTTGRGAGAATGSGSGTGAGTGAGSTSSAQIQVVSTGRYTVQLAVDSADIARVAVGQTATVTRSTSSAASGRFGGFGGAFAGGFGGFARAGAAGQGAGATGQNGTGTGTRNGTGTGTGTGAGGAATGTGAAGASTTGLVTAVGKIADASSGVATYPVTIAFDSTGTDFYVGSTVTGEIATEQRANVVQVSSLAITTTDTGSTVTVATNGTLNGPTETRTVTTGLTANGSTEVTSGLKAGDQVVITINRPRGVGGFSPPAGGFQRGAVDATKTGG